MSLILTKIQFIKQGSCDLESGEVPFYEQDGKFYLKESNEEITIVEESTLIF